MVRCSSFSTAATGTPGGLAVVDAALMTALIEVQTTGRVTASRREPRAPTAVDAALVRHALDGWFAGLSDAGEGQRWPAVLGPVPDLRAALLKLEEGRWTETRVDLDLGGGKREGRLSLYLPVPREARRDDPAALQTVVLPVETVLDAVLCRVRVPLRTVLSLAPGQLLPLPGSACAASGSRRRWAASWRRCTWARAAASAPCGSCRPTRRTAAAPGRGGSALPPLAGAPGLPDLPPPRLPDLGLPPISL
jgi:flagellar motor switch/type III secretory pathway protein FliN